MFRVSVFFGILAFAFATPLTNEPRTNVPMPDGRIIGGVDASIEDFPFMVSVRFLLQHICSGSVISQNSVITAAHCVIPSLPSLYSIQYGKTDISLFGSTMNVKELIIHSDFVLGSFNYDIAIVKTWQSFVYSPTVQPILLATEIPAVGTDSTIAGWGGTIKLQSANIIIVDQNTCENIYTNINPNLLICAGINGKGPCQGDAGGPLVINTQMVGVTISGINCENPNYPAAFTRITQFTEWIQQNSDL